MKNAFYFTLKALSVLKIFKFLSWLFGHAEKRLDEKGKINFKIYDVATWLTNNCKHMLTDISGSKDNQAMKFGQLIECSMRNIFLEKSYTKCVGETIPRPFFKKSKLSIPLDQYSKVLCSLFSMYTKFRTMEIY